MQSHSNPIVDTLESSEKERKEKEAFRHEFMVTMVVETVEDVQKFAAFHLVKKFCSENHVAFSTRDYDSKKYEDDRENIVHLPAFHLSVRSNRNLLDTFYPRDNPIQKIQDEILQYHKEIERKRQKKEAWEKKVQSLISFFESFSFKKKPKLEVAPRKKKVEVAKVPIEYESS